MAEPDIDLWHMTDTDPAWKVLFQTDDVGRARAVATSIAAMGFAVRCADVDGAWEGTSEPEPGRPPYKISVLETDVAQLAPVLDEIIDEQLEFDAMLDERAVRSARLERRIMLLVLVLLIVAVVLVGFMRG
jgi:hypothetical protein